MEKKWIKFLIFITALVMGMVIGMLIRPAHAQPVCALRDTVLAGLEKTYKEEPVAIGLASNGGVIEVIVSPSGSFTIILTRTNGISCVMAAGEAWENIPFKDKGQGT